MKLLFCQLIVLAFLLVSPSSAEEPLTEIVVTAELLESNSLQLPNSVSVIGAAEIEKRSAHHLEDLLNLAPNVNFATGASRGRFIQIRGIGERSEFQEPIINSVGVVVDGIDFTGIATAASTLDVKQVEILRGPQGTLYGANALAGMINIVSNKPVRERELSIHGAVEEFGGLEWGGVIGGAVGQDSAYRLAIKQYQSDGFIENNFLGRDDTNNVDETTARLRIHSPISDRLTTDLTVFVADIENGYDAFSLDNSRQTYSDQPGVDAQETLALSAVFNYELSDSTQLFGLVSRASSELIYSYDEDWSNTSICDGTPCDSTLFGFDWFYSSFDRYQRDNDNTSLELRLLGSGGESITWVTGVYLRDQSIDLLREYTFAASDFSSQLETSNAAVYGQVDFAFSSNWSVSTGLRFERRQLDYNDNTGAQVSPEESLWGGRVALEYAADSGAFYYGLISRGYKPGGFNLEQDLGERQREFETETMINYELGVKHRLLEDRLRVQVAAFYQDRGDIQSKQSIVRSIESGQIGGVCPCSFTDFTDNATSGRNIGVELELAWAVSDRMRLNAILGLLNTEFDQFLTFDHVNADLDAGIPFNLEGREQAHAPSYQWLIGASYTLAEGWVLSGSVEAKDEFFFSERHEERSDAYELLNLELAYTADKWSAALYARNVTDELVKTRGFGSFGNDPRKFYETEPYNQFAAPRVVGVKGRWSF